MFKGRHPTKIRYCFSKLSHPVLIGGPSLIGFTMLKTRRLFFQQPLRHGTYEMGALFRGNMAYIYVTYQKYVYNRHILIVVCYCFRAARISLKKSGMSKITWMTKTSTLKLSSGYTVGTLPDKLPPLHNLFQQNKRNEANSYSMQKYGIVCHHIIH